MILRQLNVHMQKNKSEAPSELHYTKRTIQNKWSNCVLEFRWDKEPSHKVLNFRVSRLKFSGWAFVSGFLKTCQYVALIWSLFYKSDH